MLSTSVRPSWLVVVDLPQHVPSVTTALLHRLLWRSCTDASDPDKLHFCEHERPLGVGAGEQVQQPRLHLHEVAEDLQGNIGAEPGNPE